MEWPITVRGSPACKKDYREKLVFRSSSRAGITCPNDQQLGRLLICTGFLLWLSVCAVRGMTYHSSLPQPVSCIEILSCGKPWINMEQQQTVNCVILGQYLDSFLTIIKWRKKTLMMMWCVFQFRMKICQFHKLYASNFRFGSLIKETESLFKLRLGGMLSDDPALI